VHAGSRQRVASGCPFWQTIPPFLVDRPSRPARLGTRVSLLRIRASAALHSSCSLTTVSHPVRSSMNASDRHPCVLSLPDHDGIVVSHRFSRHSSGTTPLDGRCGGTFLSFGVAVFRWKRQPSGKLAGRVSGCAQQQQQRTNRFWKLISRRAVERPPVAPIGTVTAFVSVEFSREPRNPVGLAETRIRPHSGERIHGNWTIVWTRSSRLFSSPPFEITSHSARSAPPERGT